MGSTKWEKLSKRSYQCFRKNEIIGLRRELEEAIWAADGRTPGVRRISYEIGDTEYCRSAVNEGDVRLKLQKALGMVIRYRDTAETLLTSTGQLRRNAAKLGNETKFGLLPSLDSLTEYRSICVSSL